jgi:hypothetical protein
MRFGRLKKAGNETPVVFVSDTAAVDVSDLVPDWSRETLAAGGLDRVDAEDLSGRETIAVTDQEIAPPLARPGQNRVHRGLTTANMRRRPEPRFPNNPSSS